MVQLYNTQVIDVPYSVFQGCDVVKNMVLWDWKYNELLQYFDEVDPRAMEQGDVCIWTEGPGGHTAIYDHYDGVNCWYFSQNPNPSQIMIINMQGHHAFRRKKPAPAPTPPVEPITPTVERDEYKNQVEVKVEKLRVRKTPSLNGEIIGFAAMGYYNYFETADVDGYVWFKIAENQWVAFNEEWLNVYPAKEEDKYIKFKILSEQDGYAEIDLGKVFIKE